MSLNSHSLSNLATTTTQKSEREIKHKVTLNSTAAEQ